MTAPTLIKGGLAVDDRGVLSFVNDFSFTGVKRAYIVENHRPGFVRAWHGHQREAKYVLALTGSALVCAVPLGAKKGDLTDVFRGVLSAAQPAVLYIPPGYANGWKSLTAGAKLMFFSTAPMEESKEDDIRFQAQYWNPWKVEER